MQGHGAAALFGCGAHHAQVATDIGDAALTALRVFGTFRSVTICAAVVSVVNFLLGMVLSYVFETPSGASVVVVGLVVFLLFCGVQRILCRTIL